MDQWALEAMLSDSRPRPSTQEVVVAVGGTGTTHRLQKEARGLKVMGEEAELLRR